MLEWCRVALRRAIVRGGRGRSRPLWRAAHRLLALAVLRYLTRDQALATSYARGSLARDDVEIGLSDVDLAIVLADDGGRGAARVRERWSRLQRRTPRLGRQLQVVVYEEEELRQALAGTSPTAAEACYFGTQHDPDLAGLRHRPGLYGRAGDWRKLRGPERRPPALRTLHGQRLAAWLELQFWWRTALTLCADPDHPLAAHTCVKVLAEASRVWLWLAHGERAGSRRACLERALRSLPDEEAPLRRALDVHHQLARAPVAPLGEILPAFVRISSRIERLLFADATAAGTLRVRLVGATRPELALPDGSADAAVALAEGAPVAPLADWQGVVVSPRPDEAIVEARLALDRPDAIRQALAASRHRACFAALRHGPLLVVCLPGGGGALRPLQSAATDPVSFAVLAGAEEAAFPNLPGLSAADWARRAVIEHHAWLTTDPAAETPTLRALGRHLTAARAALFAESIAEGSPRLAVTVAAAAGELGEWLPLHCTAIDEAAGVYRECRLESRDPPRQVVTALRRVVLALEAYASEQERAHVQASR